MRPSIESDGETALVDRRTNPFATRWTRPGAIPFVFSDGMTIEELLQRLATSEWRGAIVGPHGSGKSALLATLVPAIEATGRRVRLIRLHDRERRFSLSRREFSQLDRASIIVIDGYEQLGRFRRWWLVRRCRRRGCGLLVTSHKECGLPVVFRTAPDIQLVEQLINGCLPPHDAVITNADVHNAWRRHEGNVREVFFALYDVFEARRHQIHSRRTGD